jgi:predicted metalloprotease with PDZ domain
LRHEMFHLWIPEGVNLTGNYDWFYEGFALYQSLKLGVAVNRLRFEDYLDSLSQAIAIDRRLGGKMSLIDASKNRWTGDNNSVVYARGMLVAFLCDLAMLEASKGKRSTDDIVREVYRRHSGEAKPRDGNEAVMDLMRSYKELVPIVERYVTGTEKLDMTALLTAAGLESADGTMLKAIAKPNSGQKKILDKLGYNNWRKLSSTRK